MRKVFFLLLTAGIIITAPCFAAEEDLTAELATSAVSNPAVVYAKFKIREQDAAKITEGLRAKISADAFPDQIFEGIIETVSEGVAKVRIDNSGGNFSDGQIIRIKCGGSSYLAELAPSS